MGEWKTVMLTSIISLIVAFITAIITSKVSFRSDIKKMIHSKREALYVDFYTKIEKTRFNKQLVYHPKCIELLERYAPKFKLIASKRVCAAFDEAFNLINSYCLNYQTFSANINPFSDENFREQVWDGNGPEDVIIPPDWAISDFEEMCKKYRDEHIPEEIDLRLNKLYTLMRRDLGSN